MNQSSLDRMAARLAAHLDCTQDVTCWQIMRTMVKMGQPLAPIHLAKRLQMSQESLMAYLARVPDTEFDEQGNIMGWGITLIPTQHQFRLKERSLFTWCAFDTILFPSLLQVEAHIQSECSASGQPITFRTISDQIMDLTPSTCVLSLILPDARYDCVRGTFCEQSLFFQTKEAALPWMALHPEAVLLPVEEAAVLGRITAQMCQASPSLS